MCTVFHNINVIIKDAKSRKYYKMIELLFYFSGGMNDVIIVFTTHVPVFFGLADIILEI